MQRSARWPIRLACSWGISVQIASVRCCRHACNQPCDECVTSLLRIKVVFLDEGSFTPHRRAFNRLCCSISSLNSCRILMMKFRLQFAPRLPDQGRHCIEWARQYGLPPVTEVVEFLAEENMGQLQALHPRLTSGGDLRSALRGQRQTLAHGDAVASRFLPVYVYRTASGKEYRYSLMLALADHGVEWTARVWRGMEYQGMLVGHSKNRRSRQNRVVRAAIQHELEQAAPNYTAT